MTPAARKMCAYACLRYKARVMSTHIPDAYDAYEEIIASILPLVMWIWVRQVLAQSTRPKA